MRVLTALLVGSAISLPALQYDPFAEARRVAVAGTSLAYVARGSGGSPLVFVHGSGADLRTFGYQLQYFEQSRKVIVYSRRHHYPNQPPAGDAEYRTSDHVADLAAVVHQLAGGHADVVGTSSGGLIAVMLAAEHPALVGRLVLVEPVAFGLLERDEARQASAALEVARRQLREGATEDALRSFVAAIIAPGAYEFMPASTRQMLHDNLPELAAEARAPLPGTSPPLTCARLAGVTTPTLVITGGSSAPFLKAMSRRVTACLGRATGATIDGAAHAVHAQQVDAFNQRVKAFFDRSRPDAAASAAILAAP